MDDTLQELENELKRLRPTVISPAVLANVERSLGPASSRIRYSSATSLRSWKWAGWSLAAALAAVLLFLNVDRPRLAPTAEISPAVARIEVPPAPPNRYAPVRASSVLYALKEDGPTTLPDETEGRRLRYRYVDTYTWKNPATNASLRWSVPRDEVRIVRASLD